MNLNPLLPTDANDKLLRQNDMIANAQRTVAETEEVARISLSYLNVVRIEPLT